MVATQIEPRGIHDQRVLAAMKSVPRHLFVPDALAEHAYDDAPLNIGGGQTISQPYMVALMTQCARIGPDDNVLEVGTGSGYHTAILSYLAGRVWSVERMEELHQQARRRLKKLGARNVGQYLGDGTQGHPENAPYQAIVVAAATDRPPPALLEQLADGGRLVIPLGPPDHQELAIVERTGGEWRSRSAGGCRFVPLIPD